MVRKDGHPIPTGPGAARNARGTIWRLIAVRGEDDGFDRPRSVQICTLRPPSIKLSHRSMRRCFSLIRKPATAFLCHQVGRIRSRRMVRIVARSCILNQVVAITYRTFRSNYLLYGNDAGIDRGPAGRGLSCDWRRLSFRLCSSLSGAWLPSTPSVSIEDKDHLYGETDTHAPGIIEALIHDGILMWAARARELH